jgi:single-strand DNA-binding protein
MTFGVNRVELIGRIGHEPRLRSTADGQVMTKLSLATDRPTRSTDQPETEWHQIVCWGALAEFAAQYVTTGRLVFIAGRLTYRRQEGADGGTRRTAEVMASELILLDRRSEGESREVVDEVEDAHPS